jgi:hypothetical protein
MRKGLYLGPWAKNKKNKGTLLSLIYGSGAEILALSCFLEVNRKRQIISKIFILLMF